MENIRVCDEPSFSQCNVAHVLDDWIAGFCAIELGCKGWGLDVIFASMASSVQVRRRKLSAQGVVLDVL